MIGIRRGERGSAGSSNQPFFFLRLFGFGTGSSRVVILTSSLSHSASSIWSSIKKIGCGFYEQPIVADHPKHLRVAKEAELAEHLLVGDRAVLSELVDHVLDETQIRSQLGCP